MLDQQRVQTKALARQEDALVATRCLLTGLRQVRACVRDAVMVSV